MLSNDRFQANRFENKYLVDERLALAIRDHARAHLVPDRYMLASQPNGYAVHSLYLDSANMALCKATIDGEKNRYKLRLRYYDAKMASPVFFEVKRRVNDAIIKTRSAVRRDAAYEIIRGRGGRTSDLLVPDNAKAMADLAYFCKLRDEIAAKPMAMNTYRREAYMNAGDNNARLTLDRELRGADWNGDLHDLSGTHWRQPGLAHKGVILELKFTHRFPLWMLDLVRRFNLQRCSVPKYVECVLAVRQPEFAQVGKLGRIALPSA